ncbi:MAG: energy transducer TonB [Bacteroidota bacterium]|nr:energy transducer TonB [Bacteroidota bacterium]
MKTTMNIGTLELRNLYHRYMTEGLMIAGLFHIAVIGGIQFLMQSSNADSVIDNSWKKRVREIYIQPTIWNRPVIPNVSVAQTVKAAIGIPVPVPETEINPETTIPTQTEMNASRETENGIEGGTGTVISGGTTIIDEETAPEIFIAGIEKYPVPVYNPAPSYPEIARRAGVEGTVFIKMWVTKEGKVKQAEIVKSTSNIFDQNAIDAAILWKFTPAIMNNAPVSVWVTVPFKFRLNSL